MSRRSWPPVDPPLADLRCVMSAAAPPVRRGRLCSPNAAIASCCSKRSAIRAFISANRCCRPTCRFSSGSESPSQIRAIGMEKWAAEFISPWDGRRQEFEFADAWDKSMPFAYQVRRSEFDEILFRRAGFLGAEVVEACRATDVEFCESGRGVRVLASREDGKRCAWAARYVVDASGRDTLLGNRLHSKRRNKKHNSAAMYAHFTDARRHSRQARGKHLDLLVRPWLVLVHSSGRRRNQRRRGRLAELPEDSRKLDRGIFPCVDRAMRAARRAAGGGASRDRGDGHRQLFLRLRSLLRQQLFPRRRCLCIHRPGVLLGRDVRDAGRHGGGRRDRDLPSGARARGARRAALSTA